MLNFGKRGPKKRTFCNIYFNTIARERNTSSKKNNILFENILFEKNEKQLIDTNIKDKQNFYKNWLKLPILDDAKRTSKTLEQFQPNWIIFDHYGLDIEWVNKIRKKHNNCFFSH